MLRLVVLALAIANVLFFAWTFGSPDSVTGAKAPGDPNRPPLTTQVEPDLIRLLPPPSAASSPPTAPAASATPVTTSSAAASVPGGICMEVGPFSASQVGPAEAALQTLLPPGRWSNQRLEIPAVWIVYMGPFSDRETRQKKLDELRRLKVATIEDVRSVPELGDGFSLARFNDRASAEKGLSDFTQRGVRTARVAQLSAAAVVHMLRIERVDPALQAQLSNLRGISQMGRSFKGCAAASG